MSASKRAFIDTNVILYLLSSDQAKADRAEAIVSAGGVVSVQVLNEFVSVARRKLNLNWTEVREVLTAVRASVDVIPVGVDVHEKAISIAESTGFNIYDACIVAAASLGGCAKLFSEDMQDGRKIEGLRIVNPFRAG